MANTPGVYRHVRLLPALAKGAIFLTVTHALAQIRNVAGGEVLELGLWDLGSNDSLAQLPPFSFFFKESKPQSKERVCGFPTRNISLSGSLSVYSRHTVTRQIISEAHSVVA